MSNLWQVPTFKSDVWYKCRNVVLRKLVQSRASLRGDDSKFEMIIFLAVCRFVALNNAVLYTSYIHIEALFMVGHCHIHFDVVSKRRGQSAADRMAYQACSRFDSQSEIGEHKGAIILLPRDAHRKFADETNFLMAAQIRDTRPNAQCGRILDFSLPRAVPEQLILPLAAFAMVPFAEKGMASRLDLECPSATDGRPHPHAHVWIAQRALEEGGFGLKVREWNGFFRRDQGRHVRALVAGRLTLGCALLGIDAYVDPRRNDERGLADPEPRLPDDLWKMRDRGEKVSQIEEIVEARAKKDPQSEPAVQLQAVKDSPEAESLVIRNVVSAKKVTKAGARKSSDVVRSELAKMGCKVNKREDIENRKERNSNSSCRGNFDGSSLKIQGSIDSKAVDEIIQLVRALGWPAMVIEGSGRSADAIIAAGVPFNLTAVNRAAGPEALKFINERYGAQLLDQIRPYDPSRIAEGVIRKYQTANTKSKSFVVVEKVGEKENHGHEDFDLFDMPQPSSSAVEEETRRRNAEFAQRYFSKQRRDLDEILQLISRRTKPTSPQSSPSDLISK